MKGFDAHVHRSRHGPNGFLGFLTDLHTVQVNRTSVLVAFWLRSEEHTSELQSQSNLVCRLLLEKKKNKTVKVQQVHIVVVAGVGRGNYVCSDVLAELDVVLQLDRLCLVLPARTTSVLRR